MILLISDLHLQQERPDITRAFLHFLEGRARNAEALYILGDFFEAWIGDDAMSPYQASICDALRQLSDSGTRVFLMHGNRDFLIGEAFCRAAGCTLLGDPCLINLDGEDVLLMHGDLLCTRDEGYLKLRRLLRHPLTLWVLRHLPIAWRQKLARRLRNESKAHTQAKASYIVDVTPDEIPRVMGEAGVSTLIHGHTHRPAVHKLQVGQSPARRIVLGDWDRQGWVLEWDRQGARLEAFELT